MELTEALRARLTRYICETFAPEDDAFREAHADATAQGLPAIAVSADVGRLLSLLVHISGARRALEVGTLGGYSGTWIARALPADGRLVSLELDPKHAAVARRQFDRAGVGDRVEVRLGPALESLAALDAARERGESPPFDLAFIDADKDNYPAYLDFALRLVRPGGLITADNVLHMTSWPEPIDGGPTSHAGLEAIRAFNRRLATDPRLESTILPLRDGVAVAWVRR
jgi:predicted O-methyltransferase YrrM